MNQTVLEFLDRCPPYLCRIAAIIPGRGRRPAQRIPEAVLIERSGLPRRTLIELSYRKSWKGVRTDVMCRFASACGINLFAKNPLFRFQQSYKRGDAEYLMPRQRAAFERLQQNGSGE